MSPRAVGSMSVVDGRVQTVPYGGTASYGEIARGLGGASLARAVGSANARNPISIVIPNHRLVGSDGSLTGFAAGVELTGFAAGVERKQALLDLQRRWS